MNTHVHADHVTGTGLLKTKCTCKSLISKISGALADVYVEPGDNIQFGKFSLSVRSTPGHTNGLILSVIFPLFFYQPVICRLPTFLGVRISEK